MTAGKCGCRPFGLFVYPSSFPDEKLLPLYTTDDVDVQLLKASAVINLADPTECVGDHISAFLTMYNYVQDWLDWLNQ
jgi:hypothetical protein